MSKPQVGKFVFMLGMREALCGESTVSLPIVSDIFVVEAKKLSENAGDKWSALVAKLKEVEGFKTENNKFSKDAWAPFFEQYQKSLEAEEVDPKFVNKAFQFAAAVMGAETAVNAEFADAIAGLGENPSYQKWSELITSWTDETVATEEAPATQEEIAGPDETPAETVDTATEELGAETVEAAAEQAIEEAATAITAELPAEEQQAIIDAVAEETGIVAEDASKALTMLVGAKDLLMFIGVQAEVAANNSAAIAQLAHNNQQLLQALGKIANKGGENLQLNLQAQLAPAPEVPQLQA